MIKNILFSVLLVLPFFGIECFAVEFRPSYFQEKLREPAICSKFYEPVVGAEGEIQFRKRDVSISRLAVIERERKYVLECKNQKSAGHLEANQLVLNPRCAGIRYAIGWKVKSNIDKGLYFFQIAAKKGDDWAARQITVLQRRKNRKLTIEAEEKMAELASAGDLLALRQLGDIGFIRLQKYEHSENVVKHFQKLMHSGDASGFCALGVMKFRQARITHDYGEAIKLFQIAAQKGEADAMANLGLIYERGFGVAKNVATALKWYKESAAKGSGVGHLGLALSYEHGIGQMIDFVLARKNYEIAALLGVPLAIYKLSYQR